MNGCGSDGLAPVFLCGGAQGGVKASERTLLNAEAQPFESLHMSNLRTQKRPTCGFQTVQLAESKRSNLRTLEVKWAWKREVQMTLSSTRYLPRIADQILARKLKSSGAVQIKGPKWCGKTATAEQAAASCIYMQDPDNGHSYMQLANSKPSILLRGDKPRLIDEWQMAPQLWLSLIHI